MIVVKPMSGQTKIKVTGLYQWDQLQTLQFEDKYPTGTEVHFGIKDETVALVYLLENGSVRIPSVLLRRALPLMAWVHVGETTVLEIEMPVTPRAMPSDYMGIEDDVQHSIEYRTIKLEQWQVEAIKQMSDRYTKTETDQKLNLKADAKRVYTKVEANALLNEKANVNTVDDGLSDRYTKAEADSKFDQKADADVVQNALDARYTKTETDGLLGAKANKAQEAWITPTMTNGWVNFGEAYAKCGYRKDSLGVVHLRGFIKGGELNKAIFALPTGYQPALLTYYPSVSNNNFGIITVAPFSGNVICSLGNNTWVSLDGISFRVER